MNLGVKPECRLVKFKKKRAVARYISLRYMIEELTIQYMKINDTNLLIKIYEIWISIIYNAINNYYLKKK